MHVEMTAKTFYIYDSSCTLNREKSGVIPEKVNSL